MVVSFINFIHSIKKKRILKSIYQMLIFLLFSMIFISFAYLSGAILRYMVFSKTANLAEIEVIPGNNGKFSINFLPKEVKVEKFSKEFTGEQFYIEGVFIDFKDWLEFFGFKPIFKLTGIYSKMDDGKTLTKYAFNERHYFFLKKLMKSYEKWNLFEKVYGSAAFQYVRNSKITWKLEKDTNGIYLKM